MNIVLLCDYETSSSSLQLINRVEKNSPIIRPSQD